MWFTSVGKSWGAGSISQRRRSSCSSWFRQWLVTYSAPSHYLNQCCLLWIGPLGTNPSEILTKIQKFSFTKIHLKVSSDINNSLATKVLITGNSDFLMNEHIDLAKSQCWGMICNLIYSPWFLKMSLQKVNHSCACMPQLSTYLTTIQNKIIVGVL